MDDAQQMIFTVDSADDTIALGRALGTMLHPGDVIAYRGTLGAGKTTMTKGIALALGVEDTVTSPTFCLVSEYDGRTCTVPVVPCPLYHIDAYRLGGADDFESLGADDMLYGHGVCVVEWSENVEGALPEDAIQIEITLLAGDRRRIAVHNWKYAPIQWKGVSQL